MKKYGFSALAAILIIGGLVGCTSPDVLPEMLEYQDFGKKYDTSAVIEFIPHKNEVVNRIMLDNLKNNGYQIQMGQHYRATAADALYILTVVDWSNRIYECEDEDYIDTRLIVMVRRPGVILDNDMHSGTARYFQAYSQVVDSDRKSKQSGLKLAVENLFLNDEFRSAIEPELFAPTLSGQESNKQAQWQSSLYFQQDATGDFYQALRFAFLAMQSGSKDAENYLALNSLYGELFGDPQLLIKLAQKTAGGYYALGTMYEFGKGIPVDKSKAVLAYTKSAQRNYPDAQFALGRCYYYAIGVKRDYSLAHFWFKKAANANHAGAVEALKNFVVEEED